MVYMMPEVTANDQQKSRNSRGGYFSLDIVYNIEYVTEYSNGF